MRLTDCGVLGSTTDALIICGHNRSTSARKNQTLKTIMTFFFFYPFLVCCNNLQVLQHVLPCSLSTVCTPVQPLLYILGCILSWRLNSIT